MCRKDELEAMLNDGINKGIYAPTEDTTIRGPQVVSRFST